MIIEIKNGDILYPKSECLIIPSNCFGISDRGVSLEIFRLGMKTVQDEIKEYLSHNKICVGECFITSSGRMLKRRGVKFIYHAVIKRLQSDFTSIYFVNKAVQSCFNKAIANKVKSITLCGIGIDNGEIDSKVAATVIAPIIKKYSKIVDIRVIDKDKFFIDELNSIIFR